MDCLICDHCNAEIQRGKSFYKYLGEVFCCKSVLMITYGMVEMNRLTMTK